MISKITTIIFGSPFKYLEIFSLKILNIKINKGESIKSNQKFFDKLFLLRSIIKVIRYIEIDNSEVFIVIYIKSLI